MGNCAKISDKKLGGSNYKAPKIACHQKGMWSRSSATKRTHASFNILRNNDAVFNYKTLHATPLIA